MTRPTTKVLADGQIVKMEGKDTDGLGQERGRSPASSGEQEPSTAPQRKLYRKELMLRSDFPKGVRDRQVSTGLP